MGLNYDDLLAGIRTRLTTDVAVTSVLTLRDVVDLASDRPADNSENEGYFTIRWLGTSIYEARGGNASRSDVERVETRIAVDVVRWLKPKAQLDGQHALAGDVEDIVKSLCDYSWYQAVANWGGTNDCPHIQFDNVDIEVVAGGEAMVATIEFRCQHSHEFV